jgi:hypothetical protein
MIRLFGKRVMTALAATSLTAGTCLVAAPAAHALPLEQLTCPIAASVDLTPGLTLITQPVSFSGTLAGGTKLSAATPCSSPTGVPFVGVTATFTGSGQLACVATPAITGTVSGTIRVKWFDADDKHVDSSTVTFTATVGGAVPIVLFEITNGAFAGGTLTGQPILTGINGNCVLDPVIAASFAATVELLEL